MYHIIVCDDDPLYLDKISRQISTLLKARKEPFKLQTFNRLDSITDDHIHTCDIAFLDIDFTGTSQTGIDTARRFRALGSQAVLIFVTHFIEFATEGYEVHAFRYLLKSELDAKLSEYLNSALDHRKNQNRTIRIRSQGEVVSLSADSVLYLESQQHTVIFHVIPKKKNGVTHQFKSYDSLQNYENQLKPLGFLRIHRSYLVNMQHIYKFSASGITLDNNTQLQVSERNYAEVKKQFLLWKGQQ